MADTNLKPCPFCGSKRLKVCKKNNGTKYVNEFSRRIERHNCRYKDPRTSLDITYELIKADMLKEEL